MVRDGYREVQEAHGHQSKAVEGTWFSPIHFVGNIWAVILWVSSTNETKYSGMDQAHAAIETRL